MYKKRPDLLDQIFFYDLVVIESICYRTKAKRLIYESNTTGGLKKIWTGYPWFWTKTYTYHVSTYTIVTKNNGFLLHQLLRVVLHQPPSLDQIFLSHPVVFESICYRTRANWPINKSNTGYFVWEVHHCYCLECTCFINPGPANFYCPFCAHHVQIFLCPPVVLPWFISRIALVR